MDFASWVDVVYIAKCRPLLLLDTHYGVYLAIVARCLLVVEPINKLKTYLLSLVVGEVTVVCQFCVLSDDAVNSLVEFHKPRFLISWHKDISQL